MNEHPLLMKGPLVRATLEGRKTQTRRPVKMPSHGVEPFHPGYADGAFWNYSFTDIIARSPLGRVGDRLWVRETFAFVTCEKEDEGAFYGRARGITSDYGEWFQVRYAADTKLIDWEPPTFKPSIHMPRGACRLVLPLVSVRVERVQDITEEDARAEGVELISSGPGWECWMGYGPHGSCKSARESFRSLWVSIYGQESWDANPWVWVAEWKEIEVSK